MAAKKPKHDSNTIAVNRKASFEYFIEERYEAGLELQGWEVKSLRAGKCNIADAYVTIKDSEVILLGSLINPLKTSCAFVVSDPTRTRKLLLNKKEIARLIGRVQSLGYTLIPLKVYWKGPWAKIEIALARGKQDHDKRDSIKDQQWARDRERIMKKNFRSA